MESGAATALLIGEYASSRWGRWPALANGHPMTQRLDTPVNPHAPIVLSLFRIFFGLLFLCHGTSLLFGQPADPSHPAAGSAWLSGLIELITGISITLGLFTRPAAFIASGEMAVAFFTQHLPHGFWPINNGGELSVLYCWAFFLLVFTGPGAYALESGSGRAARCGCGVTAQFATAGRVTAGAATLAPIALERLSPLSGLNR